MKRRTPLTKAMILVAGSGTRLRPLTDRIPKCMVPVGGKPLVQHTVEWCRGFGFSEFTLNPSHLPKVIMDYFGDGSPLGVHIHYSLEEQPLGTAGGVKRVAAFFDTTFLVWYGDNLSRCNLDRLLAAHWAGRADATLALHQRADVTHSGMVVLDGANRITGFVEKPKPRQVCSSWVSAGICILEPKVLEVIPAGQFCDFGRDVFPLLVSNGAKLMGYQLSPEEGLWWIDRPEDLARVEQDQQWQNGNMSNSATILPL